VKPLKPPRVKPPKKATVCSPTPEKRNCQVSALLESALAQTATKDSDQEHQEFNENNVYNHPE
jgi:hypothetical protein